MGTVDPVQAWWDSLTLVQRREVARTLRDLLNDSRFDGGCNWALPWAELLPFSQQMRLKVHYELTVSGKASQ